MNNHLKFHSPFQINFQRFLNWKITPLFYWFLTIVLILGSIRGILVINLDISSKIAYQTTSFLLLITSFIGYFLARNFQQAEFVFLKKILHVNLFLGLTYAAFELFLGSSFDFGLLYIFLAPYSIFVFLRIPRLYFKVAITIITLAICYSVYQNFIVSLNGIVGRREIYSYMLKLRPDKFTILSHTGNFYRAAGFTGNYHDSANILGMALSFYFVRFLIEKRFLDLAMFLISLKCITLTQSAANISIAVFTLIIFCIYILYINRQLKTFLFLILGLIAIFILIKNYGNVMSVFIERIGKNGDWKGMLHKLDLNSLFMGLPFIYMGHASTFSSSVVQTEVAILKIIYQFGIINSIFIFMILLYPLYIFTKLKFKCVESLPSLSAVVFGFLSLLHYGSLFRVTSIFLFYAFYSLCISNIYRKHLVQHL